MSPFTLTFFLFLFIMIVLYFNVPKKIIKHQWVILLIASYIFYAFTGIKILAFLIITTFSTWSGAIWLENTGQKYKELAKGENSENKKELKKIALSKKRRILALILVLNFGILIILKYTNFFIENINNIFTITYLDPLPMVRFLLPLGISFYTFQSMGYLIDIYRGKYKADKNPFQFALFVSYFPQIIQGPISRYDALAKQLYSSHQFEYERVKFGIQRMLWGYFKKMVIADRIAIFSNEVFSNYLINDYKGIIVFLGVFLYSIQIYADFSGGIDIICGVSQILGVDLIENFRHPFLARSVAEFWQRWHITLGAWMRDYLFYPLALSKAFGKLSKKLRKLCGTYVAKVLPTCMASFIVFLIVGIWHGAAWKYIAYGLYQATFVSTATLLEPIYSKFRRMLNINIQCYSWRIFQIVRTVFLVTIGRYFSRGDSFLSAIHMLKSTVSEFNPWVLFDGSLYQLGLDSKNFHFMLVTIIILFTIDYIQERGIKIRYEIAKLDIILRWLIYFVGIFSIIVFGIYGLGYDSSNFIYQGF